jgi:hypothetical protein
MARKKKQKRVKLPSMVSLRRKAMRLWTEKVKDVQGRVCAVCGSADGADNGKGGRSFINAHHIEDRTNYALRWDLLNGIALCPSHHEFGKDSAHRAPVWFLDWLTANRPMVVAHVRATRATRPQTSEEYSRDDLTRIVAELERPVTDGELETLGLARKPAAAAEAVAEGSGTPPAT